MNPLSLLIDIIPSKYRKIVYALLALFSWGWTIWQAADGNWDQFVISLVTALVSTTASVNTSATDLHPAGSNLDPDDGLSYEDKGGQPLPPGV